MPETDVHHDDESAEDSNTPVWAWILVGACVLIPITAIGGLVPSLLGAGGAISVLKLARDESYPPGKRMMLSFSMTVFVWCLFVGFSWAMHEAVSPNKQVNVIEKSLDDETVRQEIFKTATRSFFAMDETREKIAELRREGKDTSFFRKRLARQEERAVGDREFAAKFHRVSLAQVELIVAEGLAEDWPGE